MSEQRRTELATNLQAVRERIERACEAAGRSAAGITLVAVTKTWPASDVRLLAELGMQDIGENRDQEARAKVRECADLDLTWHFVGQLQTNKCRSVASYASVVHSVDRLELVRGLSAAAGARGRPLTVLVQVALDDTPGRGGAAPADVVALAGAVAAEPALTLGGLMAVAPLGDDRVSADPDRAFDRLAEIAAVVQQEHPAATWLSAGMTGDLEPAIRHGATHVRIGTALLGHRVSRVG